MERSSSSSCRSTHKNTDLYGCNSTSLPIKIILERPEKLDHFQFYIVVVVVVVVQTLIEVRIFTAP